MNNPTSEWKPKYLHIVSHHVSYLDHRIVPELGACFAAMMSRVPKGGIMARYKEVVIKTAREVFEKAKEEERSEGHNVAGERYKLQHVWEKVAQSFWMGVAEERLTQYPLPLCVHNPKFDTKSYDRDTGVDKNGEKPGFINLNVALYGHGSIKELTGNPVVFVEHISWWMAYLTFDNPLVSGQEMSTRAVWRRDWPIAKDAYIDGKVPPLVTEMHKLGLEIAWHETEAWKVELKLPCLECKGTGIVQSSGPPVETTGHTVLNPRDAKGVKLADIRALNEHGHDTGVDVEVLADACSVCANTSKKYPWMNDPQAFRPAFDRARWALPGTFETGVAHTASVRVMGRVLKVMRDLATASGHPSALAILDDVEKAYSLAIPGMAGMWLREAVHDDAGKRAGKTRIINEMIELPRDDPNKFGSEHPDYNPYLHDPVAGAMVDVFIATPFTVTEEASDTIRKGSMPEDSKVGERIPVMELDATIYSKDHFSRIFEYDNRIGAIKWDGNEPIIVLNSGEEMVEAEFRQNTKAREIFSMLNSIFEGESPVEILRHQYVSDMTQEIANDIDDHMGTVRSVMEKGLGLPEGTLDALGVPDKFLEGSTEFSTSDIAIPMLDPMAGPVDPDGIDKWWFDEIAKATGNVIGEMWDRGERIAVAVNIVETPIAGTNQFTLDMTILASMDVITKLMDQDHPVTLHTSRAVYTQVWVASGTESLSDSTGITYTKCNVMYGNKELKDLGSMISTVHDEITFEVPPESVADIAKRMTEFMNERSPGWDKILPVSDEEILGDWSDTYPTGSSQNTVNSLKEAEKISKWHGEGWKKRCDAFKQLPGNITFPLGDIHSNSPFNINERTYAKDGPDTEIWVTTLRDYNDLENANIKHRRTRREYVDDYFNSYARVDMTIRCSLAAARDWHRHRTAMPWQIRVVRGVSHHEVHMEDGNTFLVNSDMRPSVGDTLSGSASGIIGKVVRVDEIMGNIQIDHHYKPISDFGKDNHARYIEICTELHDKYMANGNQWMAMLCLPLGTRVEMKGQAGLKDAIYLNELRGWVSGGNFEYKEQARSMMRGITTFINSKESDILTSALKLNQEFPS